MSCIPNLIGWSLIATANSITMLLIARVCLGFSNGWSYVVMPMYLAEIASNAIRGSISVLTLVVVKFGILFEFIAGYYLSIHTVGWIGLVFPIVFAILFVQCPETPYYLLSEKLSSKAYKSLVQLRGHDDVQKELDQMQTIVELNQLNRPTISELISKQNRRSLSIILALATIGQLNGSNSILSYAEIVFENIHSAFPAGNSTMILGIVELVACVCGSLFMDRFGRRPIMFVSIIPAIICNSILSLYFILQNNYNLSGWTWIPIMIIMISNALTAFGMITLPMVLVGEIFPKHLKGTAAITLVLSGGLCAFVMAKVFQIVIDSLGYAVMFGMFAIICLLYTPYFWYMLPETKGKSFQVILDELHANTLK